MVYNRVVKKAIKRYPAFKKRYNVYYPAARQLARDVMYLKGLVNAEPKYHNVNSSNNFNYAGTVVSLCDVPQGDGELNRDGNRILPRYINIKFHINRGITSPTYTHTTIRYIIFRWWGELANAVGTPPIPGDILSNTGNQYAPLSMLNSAITGSKGDRNRRIEVHRTGHITLDSVGRTSYDDEFNIKLNGKNKVKEHMEFYDGTTNPPTAGGFFMLFVNDNPTNVDAAFYLSSRLVFYDN